MDTMRRQGLSIGTKFGLIIALGTVLILAVTGTVIYQQVKLQDEAQTQELTAATVEHIRAAVGIVFGGAMDVLNATNDNLVTFKDDGIVDPQVYDTILKRMLDSNRFGAWLIWDAGDAPARGGSAGGALDAGLSIYWHRNGMDMLREPVPADIIESDLYRVPRTRNHAYLFAPHLIEAVAGDPTLVVSISQPLAHDGRTVGVIAVDIKLDSIVDGLKAIGLPAGASMTVISDDGVIAMSSDGTEPGTPIASADRNLRRIFDQARRGDGYEIGAGADAQSKLYTSWSRISVATVDDAWYLVCACRSAPCSPRRPMAGISCSLRRLSRPSPSSRWCA